MATYEYICEDQHVTVEVRGMTEDQVVSECELCGKEIKRLFTAPPIQFKGSGFSTTSRVR